MLLATDQTVPRLPPGRLGAERHRREAWATVATAALGVSTVLAAVAVLATQATGDVPAGLALLAAVLAAGGLAVAATDLRTPPA